MHPVVAERSGWRGRRSRVMMVASTCGVFVQKGGIRRVYRVRERGQGQRGGLGIPGLCRNRRFSAAGTAGSGEQSRGGQTTNSGGSKGGRGRRGWGIYRCGAEKETAGHLRELKREINGGSVTGVLNARKKKTSC
jgi:hypothetical protein